MDRLNIMPETAITTVTTEPQLLSLHEKLAESINSASKDYNLIHQDLPNRNQAHIGNRMSMQKELFAPQLAEAQTRKTTVGMENERPLQGLVYREEREVQDPSPETVERRNSATPATEVVTTYASPGRAKKTMTAREIIRYDSDAMDKLAASVEEKLGTSSWLQKAARLLGAKPVPSVNFHVPHLRDAYARNEGHVLHSPASQEMLDALVGSPKPREALKAASRPATRITPGGNAEIIDLPESGNAKNLRASLKQGTIAAFNSVPTSKRATTVLSAPIDPEVHHQFADKLNESWAIRSQREILAEAEQKSDVSLVTDMATQPALANKASGLLSNMLKRVMSKEKQFTKALQETASTTQGFANNR